MPADHSRDDGAEEHPCDATPLDPRELHRSLVVAQEQAEHLRLHDALTGLPNRTAIRQSLMRCAAARQCGAILVLDVDRLGLVNEALGDAAGDELLAALARRLEAHADQHVMVGRFGAGEFAALIHGGDETAALRLAQKLQLAALEPVVHGHTPVSTTLSIGVVVCRDELSPEEILRRAHVALRRAKALGRGHVALFEDEVTERALRELELERDLVGAATRGELELHYQPILSLESRRICGFEALARWRHPRFGMVSPAEFIPLAEASGQIVPIGRWVLETAVHQASTWQATFAGRKLGIAVNLSARQLLDDTLVATTRALLRKSPLQTGTLAIEVTETAAMASADRVAPRMHELMELGASLSLDDFGTGFSSLAHLVQLPIAQLKIDRSFVNGLPGDARARAVCGAILSLGESLRLPVTAEGIETVEQLGWLEGGGCARGQGFLFSRPIPAESATALLQHDPAW